MKSSLVFIVSLAVLAMSSEANAAILKREKCRQPITAGRCFGYVPSFAYDAISGMCDEFIYGGCGGNENRFDTMRECVKVCSGI